MNENNKAAVLNSPLIRRGDQIGLNLRSLRPGDRWGPWEYQVVRYETVDEEAGGPEPVLTYLPRNYSIALRSCMTRRGLLDWLAHVQEKGWPLEHYGWLLYALHALLDWRNTLPFESEAGLDKWLADRRYIEAG